MAIRVLVLDDSAICREQLRRFLEVDGDITVVGEASDGRQVLELIEATEPQLLVVDLQMPHADGHQTISHVMANAPRPILVVTGQPLGPGREAVFESIRRGALDLAEKPAGDDVDAQDRLRSTVRRLAALPVVRHVAGKLHRRSSPIPPAADPEPSVLPPAPGLGDAPLLVGIGSSAGGPVALATLLGELQADLRAAVLVVQHLPSTFTAAFVDFLATRTSLRVRPVTAPEVVQHGTVYVGAGDRHVAVRRGGTYVAPVDGPPRGGHRPSVDVLFESLARHAGCRAAAVVLSGIGQDGTEGLLELRRAGGLCLAQDRRSAAVWGMPKSAVESGAAEGSLPPPALARVVSEWVRSEGRR